MTRNTITDLDRITEALDLTGAIETYLWDELTDGSYWGSIESIARQLETASCANGSWSRMIYTHDIYDCLRDDQWQDAVDEAIESYADETCEPVDLSTLGEMVTRAVDLTASTLAHRLRYIGQFWVVTASVDSLDPSPDVIAFADGDEMQDWVSDEIERRVQYRVDHSPYPVADAERDEWADDEMMLFTITEESI